MPRENVGIIARAAAIFCRSSISVSVRRRSGTKQLVQSARNPKPAACETRDFSSSVAGGLRETFSCREQLPCNVPRK